MLCLTTITIWALWCWNLAFSQACTCTPTNVVQKVWGDSDVIFFGNITNTNGNMQATVSIPLKGCLRINQRVQLLSGPPCAFKLPVGKASQTYLVTGTKNTTSKIQVDRCGWTKLRTDLAVEDNLWLLNQYDDASCASQQSIKCANNQVPLTCDSSVCNLSACPGTSTCETNPCSHCAVSYFTSDGALKCGELGGKEYENRLCPLCKKDPCEGKKKPTSKDCVDWQKAVTCVARPCTGCHEPAWLDESGREVCLEKSDVSKCADVGGIQFNGTCPTPKILGYANYGNQQCVPIQGCAPVSGVTLFKSADKCREACSCTDFANIDMKFNVSDANCNQTLGYAVVKDKCAAIKGCSSLKAASVIGSSLYPSANLCQQSCSMVAREYDIINGRPTDWKETVQGKDVTPNYNVVFPRNKVNEVVIKFESSEWTKMQNDLTSLMTEYAQAAQAAGAMGRRLLAKRGGRGKRNQASDYDYDYQQVGKKRGKGGRGKHGRGGKHGGKRGGGGKKRGGKKGGKKGKAASDYDYDYNGGSSQGDAIRQMLLQQLLSHGSGSDPMMSALMGGSGSKGSSPTAAPPSPQQANMQNSATQQAVAKMFAGDALPDGTCNPLCGSGGYCPPRRDVPKTVYGFNEQGVVLGRDPSHVRASLTWQNTTWHNIGIRYKGGSSISGAYFLRSQMLPFRIETDDYSDQYPETKGQRLMGFQKLTFSNNWMDKSHIREILSYEILGASGVKAQRATPIRVYFDIGDGQGPTFWGLYTMVEDPTDVSVRTYRGDLTPGDGNMYKPANNTWYKFDQDDFKKENNDKKNASWSDIQVAINALHAPTRQSDPKTWRANLEKVFNVTSFLKVLAVTSVIGDWDSYGLMAHNYYLYNLNGHLEWIPWDFNLALNCDDRTTSIFKDELGAEWPLISYLLADPVYRSNYTSIVQWLITQGPFVAKDVIARKNQLIALVTPHIEGLADPADPQIKLEPERAPHTTMYNPSEFPAESAKMDNYINQRVQIANYELQAQQPVRG